MTNTLLITGCTQGLGHALALRFAKENCKIYAVGRNKELIRQLADKSTKIIPIAADISNDLGRKAIFETVKNENSISIIHNAAIATPATVKSLSKELLENHFETNLFAPIILNKMFLPLLKKNSRVLHISSGAAELALPGLMAYCTSKAALERSTHCFNAELNSKGIYFANLRPGMVDTGMQRKFRDADISDLPDKDFYLRASKEKQLTPPEIVANFVTWVMLKTDNLDFSQTLWNINDVGHHKNWKQKLDSFLDKSVK
jgi:benzil reductase ((S)-benzoin forming)